MRIIVHGTPAPQGSKRAFVNQHTGRPSLVESSEKVKPWREAVKWAALDAFSILLDECSALAHDSICSEPGHIGWTQDGPVAVQVTFYLPRPHGHYGTGRNACTLRPSAPELPAKKPDLDKLLRSTLDGLGEAGIWADDSRVVHVRASKAYADDRPAGADIKVTAAEVATLNPAPCHAERERNRRNG